MTAHRRRFTFHPDMLVGWLGAAKRELPETDAPCVERLMRIAHRLQGQACTLITHREDGEQPWPKGEETTIELREVDAPPQ